MLAMIALGAGAGPAAAHDRGGTVRVDGAVAAPSTYTPAQLADRPLTAVPCPPNRRGHATTGHGVSLGDLLTAARPVLPDAKNAILRVTLTVRGAHRAVTLSAGEIDPGFGNHPAYLALDCPAGHPRGDRHRHAAARPELVVPGDTSPARSVTRVHRITVAVHSPAPTTPSAPGAVAVVGRHHSVELDAYQLAALRLRTLTVSFLAGTAPQQHTETGPDLTAVLRAAHVRPTFNTWVAAVGSDGYVATVTPAEARVGARPLLLSLTEDGLALDQPRLVADGDVKGGRYVSGVVTLVVGRGAAPSS